MENNYSINFDINNLLRNIKLKKQYVKNLRNKVFLLSNVKEKNYKFLSSEKVFKKKILTKYDNLVLYIIDISFSRSNTFFHVLDFSGNLYFFYSAGLFNYSGKNKRARRAVFKEFYKSLLELSFLKNKPVALHLGNVRADKFWIIQMLKEILFIKIICNFSLYPHNGCRKQKIRRKRFRNLKKKSKNKKGINKNKSNKAKKMGEMAEWFKAADCKSVEFFHRRFKSYFLQIYYPNKVKIRDITQR